MGYFLWTRKRVLPYIEIEYPIIHLLGVFLDIGYPSMVKQYPQTQSIAIKPDIKFFFVRIQISWIILKANGYWIQKQLTMQNS
jgi:hypothetical protein